MISSEKQQRYDQLRADVEGVYETATATNKTVQGIAAVQAMHGKRLDDLQLSMTITMGQLDRAVGKLDRMERVQLIHGGKLDVLAETVEQHTGVLREHSKRFDQLDAKIDNVSDRLNTQIDTVAERLDMKIDTVAGQLDAKINRVDSKLDKVANELNTKLDTVADGLNTKVDTVADGLNKVLALLTAGK
jgi:archaellum component FlaC